MAAAAEPRSEEEVIAKYKQLRQELGALSEKINELEGNAHENDLVLKTLEPIDNGRKCFRLVGGVLVEQNVGLVRPVVKGNAENLEQILEALTRQAQAKQKETLEFQRKWKIRVQGESQPDELEEKKGQSQQNQGVLVPKREEICRQTSIATQLREVGG